MAGFFSMDGPFVKYGTLLFDMIILSAVWALMGGILPVMILLSTGVLGMVPPIVGLLLIFICLLHWAPATCAVVYTMVEMAKTHSLNIYEYLKYVLEQRPDSI